jgi:hypothetical protein
MRGSSREEDAERIRTVKAYGRVVERLSRGGAVCVISSSRTCSAIVIRDRAEVCGQQVWTSTGSKAREIEAIESGVGRKAGLDERLCASGWALAGFIQTEDGQGVAGESCAPEKREKLWADDVHTAGCPAQVRRQFFSSPFA